MDVAARIEAEAQLAARPGQLGRLEAIAVEVRQVSAELDAARARIAELEEVGRNLVDRLADADWCLPDLALAPFDELDRLTRHVNPQRYVSVPRDEVAELYEQNPTAQCWELSHVGRPCGQGCLVMRPEESVSR